MNNLTFFHTKNKKVNMISNSRGSLEKVHPFGVRVIVEELMLKTINNIFYESFIY